MKNCANLCVQQNSSCFYPKCSEESFNYATIPTSNIHGEENKLLLGCPKPCRYYKPAWIKPLTSIWLKFKKIIHTSIKLIWTAYNAQSSFVKNIIFLTIFLLCLPTTLEKVLEIWRSFKGC